MTAAPPRWDERAARAPGGHVMQSAAWAGIREAQGWRPLFFQHDLGVALVLFRSLALGRRFAYVPRGPVTAPGDEHALRAMLAALASVARAEGAMFLKVDPERSPAEAEGALRASGYRRGDDVQPVLATLELDLTPGEDALFAGLEKDTRWSVRQPEKRGVTLREAADERDLRAFYEVYAVTGERAGFVTRTWDYYRLVWRTLIDAGHATLRVAEHEGAVVAGAMTWHCGARELYMYGATNDAGRRTYAAYGLVWESIREARRRGFRSFDLGGIPTDPNDPRDTMRGPYHFKKGFGGVERRYVGAHDLVVAELPYRAFRVLEPAYARVLRAIGSIRRG
ncbi:MAG TPA: peptidoglycan bridge formation glycyltransferase FemA/FemB family protein [Candidatus Limnocylindria bacterium]|nr:peptidoglycan bridge formation glycyltransferase FemA/FemB family protein [Candidatus Limnocylindria bacterium]